MTRPAAWTPLAVAAVFTCSALETATHAAMLAGIDFSWWQAPEGVQP